MLVMTSAFRIEVFVTGQLIAEHTVEAANALAAINLVEASYGEPPEVEYKTTHHEDGTRETALVVSGWHGYTFMARNITKMPR
jgi:hypothetical protein